MSEQIINVSREIGDVIGHKILKDDPRVIIKQNSLVNRNATNKDRVAPASDTATEIFAGVSLEYKEGSLPTEGDEPVVRVHTKGVFRYNTSGLSNANLGAEVSIVDEETIGTAGNVACGVLIAYLGNDVGKVRIDGFAN